MFASLQTLWLVDVGQRTFLRVTNMLDPIQSMDLKYSNVSRGMVFLPLILLSNFVGLPQLENMLKKKKKSKISYFIILSLQAVIY